MICLIEAPDICPIEAPDDRAMAASAMAVATAGPRRPLRTLKLVMVEDAMDAMLTAGKVTGLYKPPMIYIRLKS